MHPILLWHTTIWIWGENRQATIKLFCIVTLEERSHQVPSIRVEDSRAEVEFEFRDERVLTLGLFITNCASTGYVSRQQTSTMIYIS